jgi:hypothetical protein
MQDADAAFVGDRSKLENAPVNRDGERMGVRTGRPVPAHVLRKKLGKTAGGEMVVKDGAVERGHGKSRLEQKGFLDVLGGGDQCGSAF